MSCVGRYINLAGSADRRQALEAQLRALDLSESHRRFEAIRGADRPERGLTTMQPGELGCWLSHLQVMAEAAGQDRHLHVLEDDAVLSPVLKPLLRDLDRLGDGWDLLFTDVYLHPPPTPEQFAALRRAWHDHARHGRLTLMDLRALPFTGTTSYIVHRRSLDKLRRLLEGQWRTHRTYDLFLQGLVREGRLQARVAVPFVTTIGAANLDSTVGRQGPALRALNAFRQALHCAADPRALYAAVCPGPAAAATEPLLGLYLELLRAVLDGVGEPAAPAPNPARTAWDENPRKPLG